MESIRELRKICAKAEKELLIDRVWRFFSIYLTRIFLALKLAPPVINVSSFAATVIGSAFLLCNHFLTGGVFFMLALLLDDCDGEVARYRKMCDDFGEWLERTTAHLSYPVFFLALGLGVFRNSGESLFIVLGALAAVAKLIERTVPKPVSAPVSSPESAPPAPSVSPGPAASRVLLKRWMSHIAKMEIIYPAFLVCVIFGWLAGFLWFYAVYTSVLAVVRVLLTGLRAHRQK